MVALQTLQQKTNMQDLREVSINDRKLRLHLLLVKRRYSQIPRHWKCNLLFILKRMNIFPSNKTDVECRGAAVLHLKGGFI